MDIIEWVVRTVENLLKHGFSVTTFFLAVLALFRIKKVKRRLRKLVPTLFSDDSEVKEYVQNQVRIESKIDALLNAGGVIWNAPLNDGKDASRPTNGRHGWWMSQRADTSHVDTVKSSTTRTDRIYQLQKWWRGLNMSKLKSRKFWMAIVGALLIVLNDGLNIGVDQETVLAFAGLIASYIFGEAAADVAKAKSSGFDDTKTH